MTQFITRFAPSPTGYLHIGGARTALFNYLLALANGGAMKLRIEDTDKTRSTQQAVDAIIESLVWLGIKHTDDIVFQSTNINRHIEIANALLENGKAYKDEGAVRLKVPDGETIVQDKVQGLVRFSNKEIEDFVILRSDGSPTYMLAVVVDDFDMNITHILRGDDHLNNTPKQILIYNAMNWQVPVMAHIPLIHGADGKKLTKRQGAVGVGEYKNQGYLPEAICNYLLRLGWSHGDQEFFSPDQLKNVFGFSGMRKAASQLDFKKLENVNRHYLKQATATDLLQHIDIEPTQKILLGVDGLKNKVGTLNEIKNGLQFLLESKNDFSARLEKIADINKSFFGEFCQAINDITEWNIDNVKQTNDSFMNDNNLKFGEFAKPLRAALAANGTQMDIGYVIATLGKDEVQARLMS